MTDVSWFGGSILRLALRNRGSADEIGASTHLVFTGFSELGQPELRRMNR